MASGSFRTDGMVIAPCSIHTMSAIAHGINRNLLTRAADVTLKERRPLILMVRESPLHLGHLRTMVALAEMGAIIAPPVPGFYHQPETILDLVDHSVDRVWICLGLPERDGAAMGRSGGARVKRKPGRRRLLVAFQGERGAFSEEAARKLLGPTIDVLPCPRLRRRFPRARSKKRCKPR